MDDVIAQMRTDWDHRAKEDAKFYITCQRRNQTDAEFAEGCADVVSRIRRDYQYLADIAGNGRCLLEIGCGIGRLIEALAGDCALIQGVNISPEMIRLGNERLAEIRNARLFVAENSDLSAIPPESVDQVYSFAVFQHIPDRLVVERYLADSWRVLKPGGIFTGHFSGVPTNEEERCETWVGVRFRERELLARCNRQGWQAVTSEGVDSQYMWLTLRKPQPAWAAPVASEISLKILGVERCDGGTPIIAGGPRGFASVYVAGLPDSCCDLFNLSVRFGDELARLQYISPRRPYGHQMNVQLAATLATGVHPVGIFWRGECVSDIRAVSVEAATPLQPRLLAITDSEENSLGSTVKCGTIQVHIEGCSDIDSLATSVHGRRLRASEAFCVDPLTRLYQAKFPLPRDIQGDVSVQVEVDGVAFSPYDLQVVPDEVMGD